MLEKVIGKCYYLPYVICTGGTNALYFSLLNFTQLRLAAFAREVWYIRRKGLVHYGTEENSNKRAKCLNQRKLRSLQNIVTVAKGNDRQLC